MPCYHPVSGFRTATGEVVFTELARHDLVGDIKLPCRQCIGCRLDRAREWGVRLTHEAQLSKRNCWLTLTYDDEHLPEGGTLVYRDVQLFLKRLRKAIGPIRFYMCGEYGDDGSRPHYHVCIFGYDFPDQTLWTKGEFGGVYTAPLLTKLWPLGLAVVGQLNSRTAGYTARYCLKKITGSLANDHYESVDSEGVITRREPEFNRMSTRPGIGAAWFAKYGSDVFPHDFAVSDGQKTNVPAYYDRLYKRSNPDELELVKFTRGEKAQLKAHDNTPERLLVKEEVLRSRTKTLKRNLK